MYIFIFIINKQIEIAGFYYSRQFVRIPEEIKTNKINTYILIAKDPNEKTLQFVSMAELESKNADCDGDMESNSITDDILSVHELTLNMSPRNKILVYNKPRISFTESLILYMHQRQISDNCFPYAKFYKFIRSREILKWVRSS